MRRNTLVIDAAIALAIAGLILIVAPGLAIVAILAVLALVVCGSSFAVARWRGGGGRGGASRSPGSSSRKAGRW